MTYDTLELLVGLAGCVLVLLVLLAGAWAWLIGQADEALRGIGWWE